MQCAALAAGFVSTITASPHGHAAHHQKKDLPSYGNLGNGGQSQGDGFFRPGVLNGLNTKTGPIALDNDEGAYVVDFVNTKTESDVDLVLWSSTGQVGSWSALTVNVNAANITATIPAGGNLSVSFNPAEFTEENGFPGAAGSISGAWCPMYNNTPVSTFGGCQNTWGEFTFAHDSAFSTVDVSRLVYMNGNNMTITTHAEKGAEQACLSDMETCVYKCDGGADTCIAGVCSACNGNTGCMGMGPTSGYAVVYLD